MRILEPIDYINNGIDLYITKLEETSHEICAYLV